MVFNEINHITSRSKGNRTITGMYQNNCLIFKVLTYFHTCISNLQNLRSTKSLILIATKIPIFEIIMTTKVLLGRQVLF